MPGVELKTESLPMLRLSSLSQFSRAPRTAESEKQFLSILTYYFEDLSQGMKLVILHDRAIHDTHFDRSNCRAFSPVSY